jgi:hypothetical protein
VHGGAGGVQRVFGCFPDVATGESGDILSPVRPLFPADGAVVFILGCTHDGPAQVSGVVLDDGAVGFVIRGAKRRGCDM